jgi:hypothetical protein
VLNQFHKIIAQEIKTVMQTFVSISTKIMQHSNNAIARLADPNRDVLTRIETDESDS